jgi:pimeloyl-ACP methyl ester carboxylesterase
MQLRSFAGVDVTGSLSQIVVPTLVVAGGLDDIEGEHAPVFMANSIPGATLQLLEGVGHVPQLSRPGLLVDVIEEFLVSAKVNEAEPSPVT